LPDPILVPTQGDELIIDGGANTPMHIWMEAITDAINNLAPLTGSGSPESVVVASVGRWYVNTAAATGTGVYFKQTGDGDTGWILRS